MHRDLLGRDVPDFNAGPVTHLHHYFFLFVGTAVLLAYDLPCDRFACSVSFWKEYVSIGFLCHSCY